MFKREKDNGEFDDGEGKLRQNEAIDAVRLSKLDWDEAYPDEQNEANLSLSWETWKASINRGKHVKQILHKTSGIAEGGKLTAIMGSSGAGKSRLMNILARRNLSGIDLSFI